jgi:hypothetical protein
MKKFLVLAIVTCMAFAVTANVYADNFGQLYLDYPNSGQLITSGTSNDSEYDANLIYFGGDYYIDRIKIGVDYETGNVKHNDTDVNSLLLKGGYCVVVKDAFQLAIMGGYDSYTLKPNSGDKQEATGIVLGCEAIWQLESSSLACSLYVPLSTDYKVNGTKSSEDSGLFQLKAKYTYYLCNEHLGVSAGFRFDGIALGDDSSDDAICETAGCTLGMVYRF